VGVALLVLLNSKHGICRNDDMLAWILKQVVCVLNMPNFQAAVLFQDASPALMISV